MLATFCRQLFYSFFFFFATASFRDSYTVVLLLHPNNFKITTPRARLHVPVGQTAPERRGQELDERPGPDEQATLAGVHAHLLEVDAHEREQRAERGVEEEVERLDGQQLLVHRAEYQLDDVRLAADPVRRVLRLRVVFRVHLAQRIGVDARPDAGRGQRGPPGLAGHFVRRRHANNSNDDDGNSDGGDRGLSAATTATTPRDNTHRLTTAHAI